MSGDHARAGAIVAAICHGSWMVVVRGDDGYLVDRRAEVPLLKYESQTRDGEIWVNLDKELVYDYQEDD